MIFVRIEIRVFQKFSGSKFRMDTEVFRGADGLPDQNLRMTEVGCPEQLQPLGRRIFQTVTKRYQLKFGKNGMDQDLKQIP